MIKRKSGSVAIELAPPSHVINPLTGRAISTKSKIFKSLLLNGLVSGELPQEDPKPQRKPVPKSVVAEAPSRSQAMKIKQQLMQQQPPPAGKTYAVSASQKKVLLRNAKSKSLHPDTFAENMAKAVSNVHKKLQSQYDDDDDVEDQTEYFKSLILQELANVSSQNINKKKQGVVKGMRQEAEQENYEDEYSEDSNLEE